MENRKGCEEGEHAQISIGIQNKKLENLIKDFDLILPDPKLQKLQRSIWPEEEEEKEENFLYLETRSVDGFDRRWYRTVLGWGADGRRRTNGWG
jgi:hypothetical protein